MPTPASGFHWVPKDSSGNDLPATPSFPTQEAAEAWLSGRWERLLEGGAERVELVCEGRVLYEMGLRAQ